MAYDDHDYDDALDPEGPSAEDLERLDHDGKACLSCGSEVYDDASVCPICGEYLAGAAPGLARKYVWPVVGAIVLIIFVLTWVL